MNIRKLAAALLFLPVLFISSFAQRSEITISFNEQFFDSLLDAVFQNAGPIEFPIAANNGAASGPAALSFAPARKTSSCTESVRLLRDVSGVRTAVRFRDGKIYAPLAFSGSYSPPFIGCVEFSGWAETNVDLEFDQNSQRLVARAQVLNVSLNGTGGLGGTVIAKMLQGSIDKKINPIEVVRLDKLSFLVPMKTAGTIRMRAVGMRHDIGPGSLNVHVTFEFSKG